MSLPISLGMFATRMLTHLNGGPRPTWFDPYSGLCTNYAQFLKTISTDYQSDYHDLIEHFRTVYGSTGYPFGTIEEYTIEARHGLLYKNEKRLAFLKAHQL